jgi:hypothetical protein
LIRKEKDQEDALKKCVGSILYDLVSECKANCSITSETRLKNS